MTKKSDPAPYTYIVDIITEAWELVKQNKLLWVLGFLAGSTESWGINSWIVGPNYFRVARV